GTTLVEASRTPMRGLVRVRKIKEENMTRFSKPLVALVLGIAVSALATPSFAQRSEGMSAARAGDPRVQQRGRQAQAVHLGRRPAGHDRSRRMKHGQQE